MLRRERVEGVTGRGWIHTLSFYCCGGFEGIYIFGLKLFKLYTWNRCYSLYINYASKKFFKCHIFQTRQTGFTLIHVTRKPGRVYEIMVLRPCRGQLAARRGALRHENRGGGPTNYSSSLRGKNLQVSARRKKTWTTSSAALTGEEKKTIGNRNVAGNSTDGIDKSESEGKL